ncbi:MAG: AAA family ATPase [Anaerolineae bacterium]|nr:AAA family ATPase [Anaerolineae bacterium]
MDQLIEIIHSYGQVDNWSEKTKTAFDDLFGANGGRYPARASSGVSLRNPEFHGVSGVPFAALIHPANSESGAYGGMSFVIFPVPNAPCLIGMVVGTQGLSPDEEVLGRPGHARKVAAICAWLNQKYGQGKMLAWAKQDPVRIDTDIPQKMVSLFPAYSSVFDRYGKVIYGFFAPTENREATESALKAFLDLMFEERAQYPLKGSLDEAENIRAQYFAYLMPDLSDKQVIAWLKSQRFVILQGPPGTGKTEMARHILKNHYQQNGMTIQFHPNTTYENFVGGLAPVQTTDNLGLQFAPQKGHLMQAAEHALKNPQQSYLLHIDEINRADLSKVLGEAIFLLEAKAQDEREISLPYDFGEPFNNKLRLPENLHILGTMNSSDRSIAIVDIAVRRRFAFVKLWPQIKVVQTYGSPLMQQAFIELISIFVEHASDDAFDLVPGHSYFLESDEFKAAEYLKVNLVPLLEEYLAQGYVASFSDQIRAYLQWIAAYDKEKA